MAKQINLDSWQIRHLAGLLKKHTKDVISSGEPIVLYRQIMEKEGEVYEEIICTLAYSHVIEQRVTVGGPLPLSINNQTVYSIDEYPGILLQKSKERFQEITALLESSY